MLNHKIQIKALKAGNGDCFLISYFGNNRKRVNILIDGGNGFDTYKKHIRTEIQSRIKKKQVIDLLIITHIDQDHIKGIIYLTKDIIDTGHYIKASSITKYWFNSAHTCKLEQTARETFDVSENEMKALEKYLHTLPDEQWDIRYKIHSPMVMELYGARITILSPTSDRLHQFEETFGANDIGDYGNDYKNTIEKLIRIETELFLKKQEDLDTKLQNATSIAFLFEHEKKSILFMGDAIPEVIDRAIEQLILARKLPKLKVDIIKLSHHASRKSISMKFLELVECDKFIISTNGKKANLPNKSALAKVLGHRGREIQKPITFYFNYPDLSTALNFIDEEKDNYNFSCSNANYENGYCLTI